MCPKARYSPCDTLAQFQALRMLSALRLSQLRYFLVVASAAVVDLGGFALLAKLGAPVPIAAAISFLVAAAYNYFLISRLVFRQQSEIVKFGLFIAVGTVGLCVNAGITWMASALGTQYLLAKIIGIGVAFFVNTALNIRVVFRRQSPVREKIYE